MSNILTKNLDSSVDSLTNVSDMVRKVIKVKSKKISDLVKSKKEKNELRVSFGSDPEFFCLRIADKKIVSSIPILKRDKHDPINLGNGIKMYADNALAECSFPPSYSKEEMINRMRNVLKKMGERLGDDYKLLPQASYMFPNEELIADFGIDPWEIGCNPSFDAHLVSVEMPENFKDGLRSGSFHIHLGNAGRQGENEKLLSFDSRNQTIKLLDIFVGLSSIIFDKDPTSLMRRKYYGHASNFRPTNYGVEYRTLSNFALRSPDLVSLILELVEHALSFVSSNEELDVINSVNFEEVRKAINTCNKEKAKQILAKIRLPVSLMKRIEKDYGELDLYKCWEI